MDNSVKEKARDTLQRLSLLYDKIESCMSNTNAAIASIEETLKANKNWLGTLKDATKDIQRGFRIISEILFRDAGTTATRVDIDDSAVISNIMGMIEKVESKFEEENGLSAATAVNKESNKRGLSDPHAPSGPNKKSAMSRHGESVTTAVGTGVLLTRDEADTANQGVLGLLEAGSPQNGCRGPSSTGPDAVCRQTNRTDSVNNSRKTTDTFDVLIRHSHSRKLIDNTGISFDDLLQQSRIVGVPRDAPYIACHSTDSTGGTLQKPLNLTVNASYHQRPPQQISFGDLLKASASLPFTQTTRTKNDTTIDLQQGLDDSGTDSEDDGSSAAFGLQTNSGSSPLTSLERALVTKTKTRREYMELLSQTDRQDLAARARLIRSDKLTLGRDANVVKYLNMQEGFDNLYFVCMRLTTEEPATVQLVQADRYEDWGEVSGVMSDCDFGRGEWYCTVLVPHHQDVNKPLNRVSWRYQVHHCTHKKDNRKKSYLDFSKGYCSFDDPRKRGGYGKRLWDWSEAISLLPYPTGCCLYGPFNWSNSSTDDPHKIDPLDWRTAFPRLLSCETTIGPMFSHGFTDSFLRSVADNKSKKDAQWFVSSMIDDAKRESSEHPKSVFIPAEYATIHCNRRKEIPRLLPNKEKSQRKKSPFLWEPVCENDGTPKKLRNGKLQYKQIGRWMELETLAQKMSIDLENNKKT